MSSPSNNGSPITMQGYMMKKKKTPQTSTRNLLRSISGNNWLTRYFILYNDGKLVYYKSHPDESGGEAPTSQPTTLCENVNECVIDRVKPAQIVNSPEGKFEMPSNSFYITVPTSSGKGGKVVNSTLLVTNGPEDFGRWMRALRELEAGQVKNQSGGGGVGSGGTATTAAGGGTTTTAASAAAAAAGGGERKNPEALLSAATSFRATLAATMNKGEAVRRASAGTGGGGTLASVNEGEGEGGEDVEKRRSTNISISDSIKAAALGEMPPSPRPSVSDISEPTTEKVAGANAENAGAKGGTTAAVEEATKKLRAEARKKEAIAEAEAIVRAEKEKEEAEEKLRRVEMEAKKMEEANAARERAEAAAKAKKEAEATAKEEATKAKKEAEEEEDKKSAELRRWAAMEEAAAKRMEDAHKIKAEATAAKKAREEEESKKAKVAKAVAQDPPSSQNDNSEKEEQKEDLKKYKEQQQQASAAAAKNSSTASEKTNDELKREELKAIMKDKSLDKYEKQRRMDEVKRRYAAGEGGNQAVVSTAEGEVPVEPESSGPSSRRNSNNSEKPSESAPSSRRSSASEKPAESGPSSRRSSTSEKCEPPEPSAPKMDSATLASQRRAELQSIIKDKSLTKDDKKKKREEVNEKYSRLEKILLAQEGGYRGSSSTPADATAAAAAGSSTTADTTTAAATKMDLSAKSYAQRPKREVEGMVTKKLSERMAAYNNSASADAAVGKKNNGGGAGKVHVPKSNLGAYSQRRAKTSTTVDPTAFALAENGLYGVHRDKKKAVRSEYAGRF